MMEERIESHLGETCEITGKLTGVSMGIGRERRVNGLERLRNRLRHSDEIFGLVFVR